MKINLKMKRLKQTLLALLLATAPMIAQENITFRKPSQEILQLADYERAPSVSMSSNKEWMILSYRNTYNRGCKQCSASTI